MVVFVETPPSGRWPKMLRGYLLGAILGVGVAWTLRRANLFDPPTRIFFASLPMWFSVGLVTIGDGRHPWSARLMRSASLAVAVGLLMWAIARTSR